MKLNNKGFAISSIMYLILVMALIIIAVLLGLLNNRKMILDKQKKDIIDSVSIKELQPLETIDVSQSVIVIPQTGLYKVELCGAYANSINGSCTSGIITFQRGRELYLKKGIKNNSSNSTYLSLSTNMQSSIMFAAGGSETYYNSACDGSFISGHIGCNSVNSNGSDTTSPVHYSKFIFSNTEIKINQNNGEGTATITFISS